MNFRNLSLGARSDVGRIVTGTILILHLAALLPAQPFLTFASEPRPEVAEARETRKIQGWTLHISRTLLEREPKLTEHAVELLQKQLEEIVRVGTPLHS